MSERAWWERRETALAAVLLSIVPLLWPQVPPLTDLPGHLGRYRVMLGSDADALDAWYRFEWRLVGNLGVDLIVHVLAPLIGLEPAAKAAVIATVALIASGILWIAREVHGRVTPFAFAALPIAYGFPLQFGFVNYALGVALALNAFALWLALARARQLGLRAALFVPIACGVWLAHVMAWGVLGLLIFAAEMARERGAGRRWPHVVARAAMACLPLALPFVALLLWRSDSGGGVTGRFFEWKLQWLATILRDRWMAWDLACVLALWGCVYLGWRSRRVGRSPMLAGAGLLLALTYLLMPYLLFGSAYADMRLAPLVLILALVTMRPGEAMSARTRHRLALAAMLFLAARTAGTTISYWHYDRVWQRELAALDHVPRGARLVTLVGEQCIKPWGFSRLVHMPGMALARRAAFANDQWGLSGSALLTVTAQGLGDYAADPSQMVLAEPCALEPQLKTINESLRQLPRGQFDHVWLVDVPAHDARLLVGMTPLWRDGSSALYRIDR